MMIVKTKHQAMGSVFEIWLAGEERQFLVDAAREAFELLDKLENQISHYKPRSELNLINARAAKEPVRVEPRLFKLLEYAKSIYEQTEGAFDLTISPLVKLWGFHQGKYRVPSQDEIDHFLASIGMDHVHLDSSTRTIQFDQKGIDLSLAALGKGVAVDRMAEFLRMRGLTNMFIHGGGSSIYAAGSPSDEEGWRIGIQHPLDSEQSLMSLALKDRAMSTSGAREQFFIVDGLAYSHLLDPRAGYPVQGMLSATVFAPTAVEAEALSTAFFVLGESFTRAYLQNRHDLTAILVKPSGQDIDLLVIEAN